MLIISDLNKQEININDQLVKVIAKSYYWNNLILSGTVQSSTDILQIENEFSKTYINYILNLRFLAPDIVESILNGTQPKDLTVKKLLNIETLDWEKQRKLLSD